VNALAAIVSRAHRPAAQLGTLSPTGYALPEPALPNETEWAPDSRVGPGRTAWPEPPGAIGSGTLLESVGPAHIGGPADIGGPTDIGGRGGSAGPDGRRTEPGGPAEAATLTDTLTRTDTATVVLPAEHPAPVDVTPVSLAAPAVEEPIAAVGPPFVTTSVVDFGTAAAPGRPPTLEGRPGAELPAGQTAVTVSRVGPDLRHRTAVQAAAAQQPAVTPIAPPAVPQPAPPAAPPAAPPVAPPAAPPAATPAAPPPAPAPVVRIGQISIVTPPAPAAMPDPFGSLGARRTGRSRHGGAR